MEQLKPKEIVFDPTKQYVWKQEDMFLMSGAALQVLYNNLSENLSSPEAQEVIRTYHMFQVVQSILANQVEQGLIKEKEQ